MSQPGSHVDGRVFTSPVFFLSLFVFLDLFLHVYSADFQEVPRGQIYFLLALQGSAGFCFPSKLEK